MNGRIAFSNGSEFEIWEASNCAVCEHDRVFRERGFDGPDGCELIALGMMNEEVPEWVEDPEAVARNVWPRVKCLRFTAISAPTEADRKGNNDE